MLVQPLCTLLIMRAVLVVNPMATATTRKGRDILARALGREIKVEVVETNGQGHATTIAHEATEADIDLVVALGGDGTVNEVVNGLLADGPRPGLPILAAVPGGSANVFSRALGLSRDPIQATSEILDALRANRSRSVSLGIADDRWFTFSAGLGLDAEVVHRVETHRRKGRNATPGLYVRSAIAQFFADTDRHTPALTLHRPDVAPKERLFFGIVSNTSPWTYAGPYPVNPSPHASFETGLDLFAMTSMSAPRVLRQVLRSLRSGAKPRGRSAFRLHDQPELRFTASRPVAMQLDGEYVGDRESACFRSVANALRVVA
jgi:diacylglycerol kinase family enzyme